MDGRLGDVELLPVSSAQSVSKLRPPQGLRAAVSSVNPAARPVALKLVEELGARLRVSLASDGSIFRREVVATDVATPATTGVDRVLGCLGALLETPGRTVVVVDCGTATTVNVMTPNRSFRGGMILPGRRLLAASLHRGTAALPEVPAEAPRVKIGKSTHEALAAGVAAAMLGGVDCAVKAALRDFPDAAVFVTGGDDAFVGGAFPQWRRVDWLTLRGLHWYATQVDGDS